MARRQFKAFAISNGTEVQIEFNDYTKEYVMHNFTGSAVHGMGRYRSMGMAEAKMEKLIKEWGGYTATLIRQN